MIKRVQRAGKMLSRYAVFQLSPAWNCSQKIKFSLSNYLQCIEEKKIYSFIRF